MGREAGEGWKESKGKVLPLVKLVEQGARPRRCRVVRWIGKGGCCEMAWWRRAEMGMVVLVREVEVSKG